MQREMPILPEDTAVIVAPRMAAIGAELLVETLRGLEQGTIAETPQDHSRATLAPILKKEDGLIDFERTAGQIHNRLRGFQPWPGAYTQFRGKSLKVLAARPVDEPPGLQPGEIRAQNERLFVGCGSGSALELLKVQLEGKKPAAAREFINGYRPQPGERLG